MAIALISVAGFAHQTLSVTVITMSSDLFKRNEVATVAGMAGTFGNLGLLLFNPADRRAGARRSATRRSSSASACSIWSARPCCGRVVREQRPPGRQPGRAQRYDDRRMHDRITNPILPGFNPDPSIVRVGDDYYIATSTFEWYPGVQIHHSRDLVHWRLLTRPLTRASQLNMLGDPGLVRRLGAVSDHADGLFHLIYTDVKRYGRMAQPGAGGASLRDFHNYLVTSPRIDGAWSDPVYLNSSGFDPSLFHDDDGRKYLVNMLWDHRPGQNRFAGIVLQEYSVDGAEARRRPRKMIFTGTAHRLHGRRRTSTNATASTT